MRSPALEITSGRRKNTVPGRRAFADRFGPATTLLVGGQGIPLEEFFRTPGMVCP